MQTLVIGDIHGCYSELQDLLEKAGLAEGDAIISVGDCVDRGPETPAVLAFFRNTRQAHLIMGNHERKHVRGSRNEVSLARSQQISRVQFGSAYADAVAFMATLPLYLDLPNALIVHGFFEPGIACEEQNPLVLCGTMGGANYLKARYAYPWYELYAGHKPILVGHENYTGTEQPFIYRDRVFGLDTGCVTGKALTGLLLPAFRFISIRSRANHWSQVQRLYSRPADPNHEAVAVLPTWNEKDEVALADVIRIGYQVSQKILSQLQTESGYADLKPRQQAKLFSQMAGEGDWAALLNLARLDQLNIESARKVLKSPASLYEVIQKLEDTK